MPQQKSRIAARLVEVGLIVLLVGSAGLGFYQLNRDLPGAAAVVAASIPDGALVLDARGSLAYRGGHIPGARQLWSRDLLSFEGDVVGTLADPDALAAHVTALGLTPDRTIVVYDDGDGQNAPLVVLTLHAFGLDAVMLDGGLAGWEAARGETTRDLPEAPVAGNRAWTFDTRLVVDAGEALEHLSENLIAPVDVREPSGYAAEHIENAVSVPVDTLLPDGSLPRWSVLDDHAQRARLTRDTHPLVYGADANQAAAAWIALRAYGIPHLHVYAGPYEGLVQAGLPVSQTVRDRAVSTPSNSVCWR